MSWWRKERGYDLVRDVYRPSILPEKECADCGLPMHPTVEILLNVPPDGAMMQEWACPNGHADLVVV